MIESEEEESMKYHLALQTVLKTMHDGKLHLKMNTLRILSTIMEKLNQKLVDAFAANAGNLKGQQQPSMELDAAIKAVDDTILGQNVHDLAIVNGKKKLGLFRNGILVYKAGLVKPKRKIARTSPLAYLPSVSAVYMHLFPENHVTSGVERTVAQWIGQLSREISNRCGETADEDDVMPSHVKQAVEAIMPPGLAAHANAEGFRFMVLFEQGHLTMKFRPDFIKRKKSVDYHPKRKESSKYI